MCYNKYMPTTTKHKQLDAAPSVRIFDRQEYESGQNAVLVCYLTAGEVGEHTLRITVRADTSYAKQGHGEVERWTGEGWTNVVRVDGPELGVRPPKWGTEDPTIAEGLELAATRMLRTAGAVVGFNVD